MYIFLNNTYYAFYSFCLHFRYLRIIHRNRRIFSRLHFSLHPPLFFKDNTWGFFSKPALFVVFTKMRLKFSSSMYQLIDNIWRSRSKRRTLQSVVAYRSVYCLKFSLWILCVNRWRCRRVFKIEMEINDKIFNTVVVFLSCD